MLRTLARPPRSLPAALAALLLAGCPAPQDSAEQDPIDTVVLVTVDALSPRMLWGNNGQWETAPQLWSFFDEGVVLRNVLAPRGLTAVALTSLSTGSYPHQHGVRINSSNARPQRHLLQERFQDAGYHTMGYSANLCYVWDHGVDERVCTWSGEEPGLGGLAERDDLLVDQLVERLPELDPEQPVFLWLHLNQPHKPFVPVQEYYELFHPDTYEGTLDPSDVDQTYQVTLGTRDFDDADRHHVEAVYASQVRAVDDNIGRVLDALDAIGRYDDALIVFGADHSEELAEHHNFFYHGCPPYNDTLGVSFAFRAPSRLPQGSVLHDWVSNIDIAPTIVELTAAFDWNGRSAGRSLVNGLTNGQIQPKPVFFERGVQTAGVIDGDDKYIMSGTEGTDACKPYDEGGGTYPGELEELYELDADPAELDNVVNERSSQRDVLRSTICDFVLADDWVEFEEVDDNLLLEQCNAWGDSR